MRNSLSSFSLSLLLISAAPLAAADAADTAGHGFFESQSARDAALLESRVSHGTAAEAKSPMRQPASADALAAL
ncbi:MAG: hypothetical protein LBT53_01725, partial [Puniceicoccales bacterium]|nr:hypothetical protein [Puniceicoccales bacterium]